MSSSEPTAVDLRLAGAMVRETLRAGSVRGALPAVFPWVPALSRDEADRFADTLERRLWPALELGRYTALWAEVAAWRETAEAYAAGLTPTSPSDRLPEPVPMERPS